MVPHHQHWHIFGLGVDGNRGFASCHFRYRGRLFPFTRAPEKIRKIISKYQDGRETRGFSKGRRSPKRLAKPSDDRSGGAAKPLRRPERKVPISRARFF